MAQTSDDFDDYIDRIYNISEDTYSSLALRDEVRSDTHPATSARRTNPQDFNRRPRRTAAPGRSAGPRDVRTDAVGSFEGDGSSSKVRQLELELEIMKLKQASSGKEEVGTQAQAEDDDEDEGF